MWYQKYEENQLELKLQRDQIMDIIREILGWGKKRPQAENNVNLFGGGGGTVKHQLYYL